MFRQRNRAFDGRKYRELAAFKPRKMIAHLELEVTQDQRGRMITLQRRVASSITAMRSTRRKLNIQNSCDAIIRITDNDAYSLAVVSLWSADRAAEMELYREKFVGYDFVRPEYANSRFVDHSRITDVYRCARTCVCTCARLCMRLFNEFIEKRGVWGVVEGRGETRDVS